MVNRYAGGGYIKKRIVECLVVILVERYQTPRFKARPEDVVEFSGTAGIEGAILIVFLPVGDSRCVMALALLLIKRFKEVSRHQKLQAVCRRRVQSVTHR
jgi:hypothetical protein